MKPLSMALLLLFLFQSAQAHNIKLRKSKSPDSDTAGFDAAFNNESYISDSDSFFEGYLGYSRATNTADQSNSEDKNGGVTFITPSFLSINVFTSQHENSTEELKTRNSGLELGQKFFYGNEIDSFKPNFGVKLKAEKINLDQSRTFPRRKFDFSLEQSSTGVAASLFPIHWAELSASYYRYKYSEDIATVAERLKSSQIISTLFSNVKNTINTLAESSRSMSLRVLPISWLDATLTRTYSEDLVTNSQYYVDSIDFGFYYFPSVYVFLTSGENFSSTDSTKTKFSEITVQFNF